MYRYQHDLVKEEAIYIAGPECFYTYGYDALAAMKARALSLGFGVTLPNDHPLDMENPDLKKRADSIFEDLKRVMNETTIIVSDLEAYRGAEPDSGTIYEIGMAYAKGARSYGYTRDLRSLQTKNQAAVLKDGKVYDERGNVMPYAKLPFSPTIIGSTKIVEGDFDDCLKMILIDAAENRKSRTFRREVIDNSARVTHNKGERPLVYLAGFERYEENGAELFAAMKELCAKHGLDAVSPLDQAPGVELIQTEDPYVWAGNVFDNYQQHVRNCDAVIANLNDYRGYEVNNDVGFECGMGFQLGKKLYGYMDNTDKLIHKIPHLGEEKEFRDQTGSNVENFDYPANLMFACSMNILEGRFEEVIGKIAEDLKK
ncbi:MAG: nucleoside 2-deoxyribosyltransferase [Blautia sp.]|jgi:nucleoside 2-deoxyribosyltransferase